MKIKIPSLQPFISGLRLDAWADRVNYLSGFYLIRAGGLLIYQGLAFGLVPGFWQRFPRTWVDFQMSSRMVMAVIIALNLLIIWLLESDPIESKVKQSAPLVIINLLATGLWFFEPFAFPLLGLFLIANDRRQLWSDLKWLGRLLWNVGKWLLSTLLRLVRRKPGALITDEPQQFEDVPVEGEQGEYEEYEDQEEEYEEREE